jgi:glutamate synthase domain-containing protein 2/glutamate synthase domain-containing protein 1/glutamate synthase domain-containing protein 3
VTVAIVEHPPPVRHLIAPAPATKHGEPTPMLAWMEPPQRPRRPPTRQSRDARIAPLYDAAFEHDACGIGFVADAGGRHLAEVLPLALGGLAALAHRGAFGADGASSDGAGVSLPLDPSLVEALFPRSGWDERRPAIAQLFLPRTGPGARGGAARAIVAGAVAAAGLEIGAWRTVPTDPDALGGAARACRPAFVQAVIARPRNERDRPLSDAAFERRLVVARRRVETAVRGAGFGDVVAIPSMSCRTIVYKGLVAGARLADLYPDLRDAAIRVRYALFHQRYATNTQPTWRLAQPFRTIAHNGEINTVRGNRSQVRGRRHDASGRVASTAEALAEAGPLLSADGSDSQSLDELLELLTVTGWDLGEALLTAMPEAPSLRRAPHPHVAALRRRTAGFLAPWDGPAAIVFGDGARVGAIADRNGLRPAAFAVTGDRLVAVCSEAGAIPLPAERTVRRGRLGPGELFLVEPARGLILEDSEAKAHLLRRLPVHDAPRLGHVDPLPGDEESSVVAEGAATSSALRFLAGLHAENARLDVRTMALEGHEPLWSMGDDTPIPGLGRIDRPVADHLRQSFAQVTNPPIDAERERAVMDLRVELGRRPPLLGGVPATRATGARTLRLERPFLADRAALTRAFPGVTRRLDGTWDASAGTTGLEAALDRLAAEAVTAARGRTELIVLTDRAFSADRLPIPSVLAAGAVDTALTGAGLRGRTDLVVEAADLLDVHSAAMALAVGSTAIVPWLAIELAMEHAGGRGAEDLRPADTVANLLIAFDAGLRKTLARMGISTASSYIGGQLFETIELDDRVRARCFPLAPAWRGRVSFADLAARQLRRRDAALAVPPGTPSNKLQDPGFARFRGDGEAHRYAPAVVAEIQAASGFAATIAEKAAAPRQGTSVVRDLLRVRRPPGVTAIPIDDVEPARSIARRFVVSAMSVGALSPEAHQALTIGIQRAGGAANTGEGGEDPSWYRPAPDGGRHDARIKQVASARFGVTAEYLARGEQLEIKIAQGSKPGEGGQLPAKKATAWIASLRRGQPGMSYISPPPHHDIYSIEDLAQLIADLRAINPSARIGVKLVAARGVGTIAAGVAKAGATYVHLSGHSGGTGASPLSSIKHVGAPWELGLAEVHQTLLRNGLRDRVALRTDGGLRTGRDLLIAALLGAEEFAFGTAMLVAVGCDMARQCHLDTCPTGIATQREDLRAKFAGTPEQVERFALSLADSLREEMAAVGVRDVGELVGESRRFLVPDRRQTTLELGGVVGAGRWAASRARRRDPAGAGRDVRHGEASALERRLARALHGQSAFRAEGLALSTADRSFGAGLTGAIERGELAGPIHLGVRGAAGQSFGAFAGPGVQLRLVGQANDYVGKGLAGGTIVVTPEPDLAAEAHRQAIAGNTCLYGATAGRLHVVGRAGMRFAVRNSGARAVVEGLGPHGCEYMTGGTVVVLGPVGANFGAGMTGGRAFLYDPDGRHLAALDPRSVGGTRLAAAAREREDGPALVAELADLVEGHRAAGSALADRLLAEPAGLVADVWLVEPIAVAPATPVAPIRRAIPVPSSTRAAI